METSLEVENLHQSKAVMKSSGSSFQCISLSSPDSFIQDKGASTSAVDSFAFTLPDLILIFPSFKWKSALSPAPSRTVIKSFPFTEKSKSKGAGPITINLSFPVKSFLSWKTTLPVKSIKPLSSRAD